MIKKLKRVLILNRGEIALRIIRTLKDMDIESVLLYSDADKNSLGLLHADFSYHVPGTLAKDTYLNVDEIIKAVKETSSDGLHPGYGFLSENHHFVERLTKETNVEFIGPTVHAMEIMGDKIKAKDLAKSLNVPTVPGSVGAIENLSQLEEVVKNIGFPIILKAAMGGGGRGMRIVTASKDLEESFKTCKREALAYFSDDTIFCERFIANPRHIEFQVLLDKFGNGVYLFERDCTIQRNNQKLLEEAPSDYLTEESRKTLGELCLKLAKAVKYQGVGTIEFICESPEKAYFMEMNTRIQVEHPVTEMITGLDLIREQVLCAENHSLSFTQDDLKINGWSMEVRINAEDPWNNFMPTSGKISKLQYPLRPFIRLDTHMYEGYETPSCYDSLLGKLIAWGRTRKECTKRLLNALEELQIDGISTNQNFFEQLLRHPKIIEGDYDTQFLSKNLETLKATAKITSTDPIHPLIGFLVAQNDKKNTPKPIPSSNTNWSKRS